MEHQRAYEIERRFLVNDASFLQAHASTTIEQAYLAVATDAEVRIRRIGDDYLLTVKSGPDLRRSEQEIRLADQVAAAQLMASSELRIRKRRYSIVGTGAVPTLLEVDVFEEANAGLMIAEVEIGPNLDTVSLPEWCGEEITGLGQFYNSRLAAHPVAAWRPETRRRFGIQPPLNPDT